MRDPVVSGSRTSILPNEDMRDPRRQSSSSMTLKAPKVLVVITCHNYAGMVADAMRSVANQTYGDFECVVVDDASDDGSFDVIERAREHIGDCRFATMKLSRRRGQMNAFATGLQDRPSHLVAFLDADD